MKIIKHTSSFNSLDNQVYIYRGKTSSKRILLILKGIYSFHIPYTEDTYVSREKWDHDLINYFQNTAHVVCINSSRLPHFDQTDFTQRERSFEGKNFAHEVEDVENSLNIAIKYIENTFDQKINHIHIVAKSFGGTVVLGSSELISKSSSMIFIGSGCGKSATTTRPLLKSLYDEELLLKNISSYKGYFIHIRGDNDQIVPMISQKKIIEYTKKSKLTTSIIVTDVDHNFETKLGNTCDETVVMLRNLILNNFEMSEL